MSSISSTSLAATPLLVSSAEVWVVKLLPRLSEIGALCESTHAALGHRGAHALFHQLSENFIGITREVCDAACKRCEECNGKPVASPTSVPIATVIGAAGGGAAAAAAAAVSGGVPGVVSNQVADGPNKLFAGGMPSSLSEGDVKDLLSFFGPLRSFQFVKEEAAAGSASASARQQQQQQSRSCFFDYCEPYVSEDAVMGLNALELGAATLTVRFTQPRPASMQQQQEAGMHMGAAARKFLRMAIRVANLSNSNSK